MDNPRISNPQYKNTHSRNSSFELLRIICMYFITICHFATHGGFSFGTETISIPRIWWHFIEMGGTFGVNVFVLISGYFLISDRADSPNFKRLLKLWGQILFYSVSIYMFLCLFGFYEFSISSFIKLFIPITTDSWWFASTYFILYLLHPFLNMFLNSISKRVFQNYILLTLIIWCFIPSFTFSKYQSNILIWFVTLYSVAAYIRLYGLNSNYSCKHYLYYWIFFTFVRFVSSIVIMLVGTKVPHIANYSLAFYGRQSIFTFLSALSFFMLFKNINIVHNRLINIIASTTFGVYLIQEHISLRPILWLTNNKYQDSVFLIVYSIIFALLVFVICAIIDLIRQVTFEKVYLTLLNYQYGTFENAIKSMLTSVRKVFFDNQ